MATDTVPIAERGVATLSEQAWERASLPRGDHWAVGAVGDGRA